MAKKLKTLFICTDCGTQHPKYQGRCDGCGAWNTLQEEVVSVDKKSALGKPAEPDRTSASQPQQLHTIQASQDARLALTDSELSRVLDGGLVPGAVMLLGGEPGIGKSTLLLQTALQLAPRRILYVSGEESARQVKLRAERIPSSNAELYLLAEGQIERILHHARELQPEILIVDSVQTLSSEDVQSAPGSVTQIRECSNKLIRFAKDRSIPTILVGHVTKEGSLAGPKVLEHMVDTVLEFEGDRHHNYRLLRAVKNRFGATPQLGVYAMQSTGLEPVHNPSEIFLSGSGARPSGVAVAATLEGARPLLVEVQALVSKATYGTPQRAATGFDQRRLNMLLAVLERKQELRLGDQDVFVNLAGGLRLDDPALDLAVATAIVSSLHDFPLPERAVFAGEIGLTGELRPVSRADQRLMEVEKLGFNKLYLGGNGSEQLPKHQIEVVVKDTLMGAFRALFG